MANRPLAQPRDVRAASRLSRALLNAAADEMMPYRTNPNSIAILAAGFSCAIGLITDDIDPGFRTKMRLLLREGRE